jgi:transcriptional regulator with XRE-family HTH domain
VTQSLGEFLRVRLESRGLSGNAFAKAVGIAEGSVRNLLRYGIDPNTPDPSPQTLQRAAEFLGISPVILVNLAYGIEDQPQTALEQYVVNIFRQIPLDEKERAIDILETLAGYKPDYGETLHEILAEAQEKFSPRDLPLREKVDRSLGQLLPIEQEDRQPKILADLLNRADIDVSEMQARHVTEHPLAIATLSVLISDRTMSPAEKLYWFLFSSLDVNNLAEADREAIREKWEYLVDVAEREVPIGS